MYKFSVYVRSFLVHLTCKLVNFISKRFVSTLKDRFVAHFEHSDLGVLCESGYKGTLFERKLANSILVIKLTQSCCAKHLQNNKPKTNQF